MSTTTFKTDKHDAAASHQEAERKAEKSASKLLTRELGENNLTLEHFEDTFTRGAAAIGSFYDVYQFAYRIMGPNGEDTKTLIKVEVEMWAGKVRGTSSSFTMDGTFRSGLSGIEASRRISKMLK